MNRREFNLLSLAGLAAASLPEIAEASLEPKPDVPRCTRVHLTATGGRPIITGRSAPKSTRLATTANGVSGIVLSVSGYINDEGYSLARAFLNGVTDPDSVVKTFERLRAAWSPEVCLVECDSLAETLLGNQLGIKRVSKVANKDLEQPDDALVLADKILPYKVIDFNWCYVSEREPHNGNTFRTLFPVRQIYGDVTGDALEALKDAELLADIYRRCQIYKTGRDIAKRSQA